MHHHFAGLQRAIRDKLVTGIVLESPVAPDPVCEPCLAGKMHANPFPSSSSRAASPGLLVHSDLHGPLSKQTHQGYRYWVLFVDDSSRFRVV